MPRLQGFVGQTIIAHVPIFDPVVFQSFKLHEVEPGGLGGSLLLRSTLLDFRC